MHDCETLKKQIISAVEARFEVKQLELHVAPEFYYPRWMHLIRFNVEQYTIKDLGNMAILTGRGCGVMKMLTVVFTPNMQKDIPFVIIDFINIANKRTVFVEWYTQHIKEEDELKPLEDRLKKLGQKYSVIPDYTEKPNWYTSLRNVYSPLKKATPKQDNLLDEMVLDYLQEYLAYVNLVPSHTKRVNIQLQQFIHALIYKNNPSTAILEKAIGKVATEKLFQKVIFYYK